MSLLTDREAREWMNRALDAEAEVERLRSALRRIANHTPYDCDAGRWKHWSTLAEEALSSAPPEAAA